jgi:hypothetical protein
MKLDIIIAVFVGITVLLGIAGAIYKRRPRPLKPDYFMEHWKELQQYCRDKQTWPQAIMSADKLLDYALKRRRYKGKSMGERLVAAQRKLSNNDAVWFGHNLYKKIIDDPELSLKEADVKQALIGIRQALKDLGAFGNGDANSADTTERKT